MIYVYILQLQSDKYYVGKTSDPKFRLDAHFNSYGCAWTKKYRPVKLIELIPNCDNFDEDKYTKKCMSKYGIDNVRGGAFCQIKLDSDTINTIQQELDSATDKCYRCGKIGHFANACLDGEVKEACLDDEVKEEATTAWTFFKKIGRVVNKLLELLDEEEKCYRCNRTGHYVEDCYAKTYANGKKIEALRPGRQFRH